MVSINNLTVSFGGFTLLNDINFHISEKDCIGLVGKNGAGKSTILKIIAGIQRPTKGQILKPSGLSIGYLPQQMEHEKDKTVFEEALTAFSTLFDLKKKMDEISILLAERTDYQSKDYHKLIVELNDLNDRINFLSQENPEGMTEKTLLGLGFKRDEFCRQTSTFSQGWNMRIELAKILLKKPDLLLLDEPT
ncbi:MAG TPA: ATP-binding cassette domain-containing protein, partial [Bacteroidales bacterium]|nr:ATP-binding cassette domain-containing protein [Bacteroidales bacterium]